MAKRKKDSDGDGRSEVNEELPKRIKTYLSKRSTSTRNQPSLESERLVDEILKSPAVVAKVRKILRSSNRVLNNRKTDSSTSSSSSCSQANSRENSESESSSSEALSITPTNDLELETPNKPKSEHFKMLEKEVRDMEVDLENGLVRLVNIEVY